MYFFAQPVFKSDYLGGLNSVVTLQKHPDCRDFELRVVDCVDAYGFYRGREKCKLLIHDLYECIWNEKRQARNIIMRQERARQVKKGETKYIPAPPLDAY